MRANLALATAFAAISAVPAYAGGDHGCGTTLSDTDFHRATGRHPSRVDQTALGPLPEWWLCHRPVCPGFIKLELLIDEKGVPHDIEVLRMSFPNRWDDREAVAKQLVQRWRYAPPRMKDKPVCVVVQAQINFEAK